MSMADLDASRLYTPQTTEATNNGALLPAKSGSSE